MIQIKTLQELFDAARNHRSVVVPKTHAFSGPLPAAFVLNLQGMAILRLINSGMFLYEKGKNKSPWNRKRTEIEDHPWFHLCEVCGATASVMDREVKYDHDQYGAEISAPMEKHYYCQRCWNEIESIKRMNND